MRTKELFDNNWLFAIGDIQIINAVKAGKTGGLTDCIKTEEGEWLEIAYTDRGQKHDGHNINWKQVNLPHDWCVEGNFIHDPKIGSRPASHGYLPTGIGCYVKYFDLPAEDKGKKISIHFDGIMKKSTVWVNGHLVGTNTSGYTSFHYDLTDILRYGEEGKNVVFVKADATEYEGWWYEGCGIYRHVWLLKTEPLHVDHWGTYVTTPHISAEEAKVNIKTTIKNEYLENKTCDLITTIIDADGKVAAIQMDEAAIAWQDQQEVEQQLSVAYPVLWSPESPNLYRVLTEVRLAGELVDTYETTLGIRSIEFTSNGFLLNGAHYVIKGTCNHQDFAGVGVALPDRLIEYKIELLKEMGCNAYRSSHHPPTPELLDICDRLGMLVMDENRKLDSSPDGLFHLKSMLYRDRNHPSVILWCMENEENLEGTVMGARILRTLVQTTKKIDPTRPVLAAMNHGWNDGGYSEEIDIVGYNYGQRGNRYVLDRAQYPDRLMICSESTSSTTTRGIYETDLDRGHCSTFETKIPGWSCGHERSWQDLVNYPYLTGLFVWTGFDYRGEPTPFAWPCVTSHFGIMDICGFPKDAYFFYKSVWTAEPMVHVMPHWNLPGKEGETIPVWIYTNCEEIELILNGRSLGRKAAKPNSRLEWEIQYVPGELTAKALTGGRVLAEHTVRTTGVPSAVVLEPDREMLKADGKDVSIIRVSIVDQNGDIVPTADNEVLFTVEGPGQIIGVGNGDPSSHEPDKSNRRRAFGGRCLLLVQTDAALGELRITAKSTGLKVAQIVLTVQ